jgi:general secretion pathway protein L
MTTAQILKTLQHPVAPAVTFRVALKWWRRHLTATLQAVTPRYLKERVLRLQIDVSDAGLRVRAEPESGANLDFTRGAASDSDLRMRVKETLSNRRADRIVGLLRLAKADSLRKRLSLPAAARSNLAEAVGYQVELETPFRQSEVYFGFRLLSETASTLHLEIAAARRDTTDALISSAAELGIPVTHVYCGASASDPDSIELLSHPSHWPSAARRRLLLLSGFLAALILAMAILPLAFKAHEVAELETRAADSVKAAEPILAQQRQLAAELKHRATFASLMQRYPRPREVLSALTQAIPVETWLTHLGMHSGEIQISGFTPSTSALIDELAATGLFYPPSYGAPTIHDPQFDRERFVLSVKLKPSL